MGNVINYLKSGGGGDDENYLLMITRKSEKSDINEDISFTIPNGVTQIGYFAFSHWTTEGSGGADINTNLKNVILPNSVTKIEDSAFYGCKKLININLENVTSIGESAFAYCYNLANNETGLILNNNLTIIKSSTFIECVNMKLYSLPNNITEIESYAFKKCYKITLSNLPTSLTKIGDSAFYDCIGLTSITIPSSVTSIGMQAFQLCQNLISINNFENTQISKINRTTFGNCKSLTSITIPASVTITEQSVFYSCTALTKVKYLGQVPNIKANTFYSCNNIEIYDFRGCTKIPTLYNTSTLGHKANCQIVVPDALYDTWQTSTNWSSLTDVVWVKASEYVEATPVTTPDNV